MDKKVSVVVPVYKTQAYLTRCVESIVSQTWTNLEILLVDDGSPDDCPKMCDDWAAKDSRIKVLHKKNGGLMAAWIDGLKRSTGDYVMFADSDDWVDLCMVEKMMELSSESNAEVICCNYMQEEQERSFPVIQALKPGVYEGKALKEQVLPRLLGQEKRPITLSRCMKLFSRELLLQNIHYCDASIVMGEDVNITLPVLLSAERIALVEDGCWYHYLYLTGSMVHRYDPGLYDNNIRLMKICAKVMEEKNAPDWQKQLRNEFILLFFLVVKNEVRSHQKGWYKRLQALCKKEELQDVLDYAELKLTGRDNRILYAVIRHPNAFMLYGLRLLFGIYDLKSR